MNINYGTKYKIYLTLSKVYNNLYNLIYKVNALGVEPLTAYTLSFINLF